MTPNLTEEQRYRVHPGMNYSLIADFYQSPDHALMEREPKAYFEVGNVFETLLFDAVTGGHTFADRFFVGRDSTPPDKLLQWLAEGVNLEDQRTYNKDGSLSKKHGNIHAWIDACLENPGKTPISQVDFDMCRRLVDNMLKIEDPTIGPLKDILSACEWQAPMFWEDGEKKALADCLISVGGETWVFDIKTAASFGHFVSMMRSRYWIQDIHYTEGANAVYGGCKTPMIFLVAEKKEPFLCQMFTAMPLEPSEIDLEYRQKAIFAYQETVGRYREWNAEGRPAVGWKPMEVVRLYLG
jgi:hypothetical protein